MKKKICLLLVLTILILSGCRNAGPAGEITSTPTTYQTDSANDESGPVFTDPEQDSNHAESVSQTEGSDETKANPTTSTREDLTDNQKKENESGKDSDISQTEPAKPTDAPVTRPPETQPSETKPIQTQPKETEPPETTPKETVPKETEPPATEPPATEAPTEPEQTEPEETEPAAPVRSYPV